MNITKTYMICSILLMSHASIFPKPNTSHTTQKSTKMLKQGDKLDLSTYTTLSNGIQFKIIQKGSTSQPLRGEKVTVDYTGWLLEGKDHVGTKFDSSVDRGQKFQFPVGLGHVITGWDIMVADMKIGEKRIVILPPAYAYGSRGAGNVIKPNSTLIFEIELFGSN